jgi:hypothetical protein
MSETDLAELPEIIRWPLGVGSFTTYPGRDANNAALHAACVELESRGLVRRHRDDGEHVVWVAAEEASRPAPAP